MLMLIVMMTLQMMVINGDGDDDLDDCDTEEHPLQHEQPMAHHANDGASCIQRIYIGHRSNHHTVHRASIEFPETTTLMMMIMMLMLIVMMTVQMMVINGDGDDHLDD